MKKTVKFLSLIALVAIVFACEKEDKPTPTPAPVHNPFAAYTYSADYLFQIGEKTVQDGCNAISVYPGAEKDNGLILFKGETFNLANMGSSFVASSLGIPYNVGEEDTITLNGDDGNLANILFFHMGPNDDSFYGVSGVMKREANNKISFSGLGMFDLAGTDSIPFSGYITSKAIELIKSSEK